MIKQLFFLLIPVIAFSQPFPKEKIKQYMDTQVSRYEIGGTMLVMKGSDTLYKNAFGYADREKKIANSIDKRFIIGSITKEFTAISILQLQEKGKLNVLDPLSKYFPDYPQADKVTIQMLLTHTAGIPDHMSINKLYKNRHKLYQSRDFILNELKKRKFRFTPGSNWEYSNSGYFLLGCIIEKVSGETYNNYLKNHIFSVAGMAKSGLAQSDSVILNLSKEYQPSGKGFKESSENRYYDIVFSNGAIYSTIEDMQRFHSALQNNRLLSDASQKLMNTPFKRRYGYGVHVDSIENHFWLMHNGDYGGYKTQLDRFPEENICIVFLSNYSKGGDDLEENINMGIAEILFGKEVILPYTHKEVSIESSILDSYVGEYTFKDGVVITIEKKKGKLFKNSGGKTLQLRPESNTKFFYADKSDRQIEFVSGNTNEAAAYFIDGGIKEPLFRKK